MKPLKQIESRIVLWSRHLVLLAVLGSLAASILMFFFGLSNIVRAFRYGLGIGDASRSAISNEALAVISVIEGLDRFLIAIVLLYFAYGVYALFVRPRQPKRELALPEWLQVKQIGQLKQVVAELIIVILFVLFLRFALRVFQEPDLSELSWTGSLTFLLLPLATALLALSLRLVELHPKPKARPLEEPEPARSESDSPESIE